MSDIKCSANEHGNCQTPNDCCLEYQLMIEFSERDVKNICKWLQILENMLNDKKREVSDQIKNPGAWTQFRNPAKVIEDTIVLLQGVRKAKDNLLVRLGTS